MSVLIHMIDEQEKFFKDEIIPPFEKKFHVKADVVHYDQIDSISNEIKHYPDIGLMKVPFSEGHSLAASGALISLDSILNPGQLKEYEDTYLLTSLARIGEKRYYIPRKFETRIMVYRKSKVREAYELWRKYRSPIHEALKKINGYGLPATYLLEENPDEWDFFDVFVVGWIWAHTNYGEENAGRIAHRGKHYSGTALRLIDRVFQCGGDSAAVVSMQGESVVDALHWEAVYASSGIYNTRMWEQQWSGPDIWQGFAEGQVYLSFMTQLDCFYLHGTGRDGLSGYLSDPDDMGVAVMPRGCSVILDEKGNVLRNGTNAITTGGWWWAIPANTPDPIKSYELARHITSTQNQIQGCTRFGMIPVRKEILSDMPLLFGGTWISEIYEVSLRQLMHNKLTVLPSHPYIKSIMGEYLDAWYDIVARKRWSSDRIVPDREYIKGVIENRAERISTGGEKRAEDGNDPH